jgi:hypothetical protein
MRRRAFVRLRRLKVAAQYHKQRDKRQDDYDFAADTIDLLPSHGVTTFPAGIGIVEYNETAEQLKGNKLQASPHIRK